MINIKKWTILGVIYLLFNQILIAQSYDSHKLTNETQIWLSNLAKAAEEGTPYYSQFDQYPARNQSTLQSNYSKKTGVNLLIYGVDFYYASGSWFPTEYIKQCRRNLISIVKTAWREHKAIPCFSWHLENPYVPSDFDNYMGCRYRYGTKGYPVEHRFVIKEILENTGDSCGLGNYSKQNNLNVYKNPSQWFNARCKEVAEIIRELKDDEEKPIPIIFRLWHECDNNWQWWGKDFVTPENYIQFFRLTVEKIEKYTGTHNILYAYSPDRFWNKEEEFLLRYPGNEYVEIIGFDDYSIGTNSVNLSSTIRRAQIITKIAQHYNKIAALFETANSHTQTSEYFFNKYLKSVIQAKGVNLGLIQIWSTGKIITEKEIKDRTDFLKGNIVKTFNDLK